MSIKNPYSDFTFHGDQYGGYQTNGNIEHDAFSEGVKAANEDWIKWAESKCPHNHIFNPTTKDFEKDELKLMCFQCWKERKKEINQ